MRQITVGRPERDKILTRRERKNKGRAWWTRKRGKCHERARRKQAHPPPTRKIRLRFEAGSCFQSNSCWNMTGRGGEKLQDKHIIPASVQSSLLPINQEKWSWYTTDVERCIPRCRLWLHYIYINILYVCDFSMALHFRWSFIIDGNLLVWI
jgi:hypothetical protein